MAGFEVECARAARRRRSTACRGRGDRRVRAASAGRQAAACAGSTTGSGERCRSSAARRTRAPDSRRRSRRVGARSAGRQAASRRRSCAASSRTACCAPRRSSGSRKTRAASSSCRPMRRSAGRCAIICDSTTRSSSSTSRRIAATAMSVHRYRARSRRAHGARVQPDGAHPPRRRRQLTERVAVQLTRRRLARGSPAASCAASTTGAPTPFWLRERLRRAGVRAISSRSSTSRTT